MRKTKIVCTIGPSCNTKEMLLKMIDAGMNVARINMSHGNYDDLAVVFANIRSAIKESGKNVAILLDTKGPEVRVTTFANGSAVLKEGAEFSLYKKYDEGDFAGVAISYPKLVDIFFSEGTKAIGRELLLDDGLISILVKEVYPDRIVCRVNKGGVLKNRKSINIPGYHISMPYVSAQDRRDIEFGLSQGANVVAASFVRNHEDVRTLRDFIDSIGYEQVEIIAKIENQGGVDDMDLIMDYADGIMVARGDMGVEIPFIKLPEIQKQLIRKCVAKGKYVITATQMLESMTTNPRPTRAEISDVANAVYDGTSAVMLSGESAAGKYPVESVRALDAICTEAERNGEFDALQSYVEKSRHRGSERIPRQHLQGGEGNCQRSRREGDHRRERHGQGRARYGALPSRRSRHRGRHQRNGLPQAVPQLGHHRRWSERKSSIPTTSPSRRWKKRSARVW